MEKCGLSSRSASGPPPSFRHPIALLHENPDVFGFRDPKGSTFSPRQNPQPWCAGGIAPFNARNELRAIKRNLIAAFSNGHTIPMWGLIGGALILLLTGPDVSGRLQEGSKKLAIADPWNRCSIACISLCGLNRVIWRLFWYWCYSGYSREYLSISQQMLPIELPWGLWLLPPR